MLKLTANNRLKQKSRYLTQVIPPETIFVKNKQSLNSLKK